PPGQPAEPLRSVAPGRAAQPSAAPRAVQPKKLKLTALVITWDIGHNPLGRSYMLGEVLQRVVRHVVMVGFQFPRYGHDIWEPVRNARLPVIALPGQDLPELLDSLDSLAARLRPDIVIACKPRLPSLQLGALVKQKFGCPLIVDIDDHELSFFQNRTELTAQDLAAMADGAAREHKEPYAELWTRLAQHQCNFADERIVSNIALQREFGGTIVAHVRDEAVFDPALFDGAASRRKYGVPEQAKVVLFFGTPRQHKGVDALAEAVGRIADPAFRLVVVGTTTDRSVTGKLERLAPGRVVFIPNQPFSCVPEIVAMADVICLPQDPEHAISQFQLPAKAIDAVAMGVPLLVTPTAPLKPLIDDGVAIAVDRGDLAEAIVRAAGDAQQRGRWADSVRRRFLDRYSYAAAAQTLRALVERAVARKQGGSSIAALGEMVAQQRRVLGVTSSVATQPRAPGVDVVVFWKQNDTGLYGRRSDMVIRCLGSRPDVRRVLVFDAPTSEFDLGKRLENSGGATQDRAIYVKTYEKVFGLLDTESVKYNVFVYPPGEFSTSQDNNDRRPSLFDAYAEFIEQVFEREGVRARQSVFWIYPKNYLAKQLVQRFAPLRVAVDVVDDHRTWPGISAQERQRLTDNYRETLAMADIAMANCEPVVEAMREFCPAIQLVPNGCDASPPTEVPRDNRAFDEFAAFSGPTIGFIGNLEQKIDIELLDKVAQRFPHCQVALIGSTHANPQVLQLRRRANVRIPGVVPYAQIGAWLSKFDVGLIPHLDSEMTQSMNPLKLFVYLSWKVQVVSTEVFNLDRSSRFVHIGRTHAEFLDRIDTVLAAGRPSGQAIEDMQRYVGKNSWEARLEGPLNTLFRSLEEVPLERLRA
ncbi:MAG: glycosyltransferase, partial [Burkholderiaceae bacterium]